MRQAPFLFMTALLLMIVQNVEVRFLLVKVDVGDNVGVKTDIGNKH